MVIHCINSLTARLMYKAADKAMGVEKTKQQAKGKRERERRKLTARERDCCWTENRWYDMDVTDAGAVRRLK